MWEMTTEEAGGEEGRCILHPLSGGKTQLAYSERMQLLGSIGGAVMCTVDRT